MNINTPTYWDNRFSTGDWEAKSGLSQTTNFAIEQIKHFKIPSEFNGTILDFGCALGDAFPIYRKKYKNAKLIGLDHSQSAIDICKKRFRDIASFVVGNHKNIPNVDIIIASNVMEHITNDIEITSHILSKCKELYIIVPYKENLDIINFNEHVNSYDENYYKKLGNYDYKIYNCNGYCRNMYFNYYFKNIFRLIMGKKTIDLAKQIMFHFV